jgi:hypothetical protein
MRETGIGEAHQGGARDRRASARPATFLRCSNPTGFGYTVTMGFKLGAVTGFAAGYYMGARAGRQRYDQINRQLARLKRSEAFEQATDKAKTVVEEGVEKARSLVETKSGNGNGFGPGDASGGTTDLGGYSSSR